jgi:hypothetical protein
MNIEFIRISGYLNVIAGVALIIYWYAFAIFLPYRKLSTTAGIYVIQIPNSTWLSAVGFYIATAGTTLLVGTMLWDTILWPILVKHDESLLNFQGPIYTSKTFFPFFIVAGLIYSLGYILVGIGIIQAQVFPTVMGYLMAIGAPTFGLGSMFGKFQVYPRTIGVTLMSVSLIGLGRMMLASYAT